MLTSRRLWAVAKRSADGDPSVSEAVIRQIASDPDLHAEAKRIAAEVAESVRRDVKAGPGEANPDYVSWMKVLLPLLLYARPKDLPSDPAKAMAWWGIGYKATAEQPLSVLKKAAERYIETADKPFFPAWGKLNELCREVGSEDMTAAYRIRAAARREHKVEIVKTDADREAVRKMAAELRLKPIDSGRPRETPQAMAERLRAMTAESLRP